MNADVALVAGDAIWAVVALAALATVIWAIRLRSQERSELEKNVAALERETGRLEADKANVIGLKMLRDELNRIDQHCRELDAIVRPGAAVKSIPTRRV